MINYTFGCDANILDNSNAPLGKWFSLPDFIKSTSVPRVVWKSGSKFFKFRARTVLVILRASGRGGRRRQKKVLAVKVPCNFLFYNKLVIVIKHLRMVGKRHTTTKSRVDTRKLKRQPFCATPCSLELIKYENGDFRQQLAVYAVGVHPLSQTKIFWERRKQKMRRCFMQLILSGREWLAMAEFSWNPRHPSAI